MIIFSSTKINFDFFSPISYSKVLFRETWFSTTDKFPLASRDISHFRCCLKFCFMELLQTELDGIKDMHNNLRIRKQWNVNSIQGRPNLLYSIQHSHKKRKDSLETRAVFSWILILTRNFGDGRSGSASTLASTSWFWCYQNYNWLFYNHNWLFYMLHSDIISTTVSEAVEKIPTDEKIIANAPLLFTLHSHSS